MKIEFDKIQENCTPGFKGGEGNFHSRMHTDDLGKIMKGRLEPGAFIGLHRHEGNSEIIFILEGQGGRVKYDDTEEKLAPGDCHYCPMGHIHSLINDGPDDLVFLAIVSEHQVS